MKVKLSNLLYFSVPASVGFLAAYGLGYWLALNTNWDLVGVALHGAGLFYVFVNIAFLFVHIVGFSFHLYRRSVQWSKHLVSGCIIAVVMLLYLLLIHNGVYLSA